MATILLSEDETNIREAITAILEAEGYRVIGAANGQQALDRLGLGEVPAPAELPDLIMLDLMMPVKDGYFVLSRLSQEERFRAIPVIVLTAQLRTRKRGDLPAGATALVEKPFEPPALIRLIRQLLAK